MRHIATFRTVCYAASIAALVGAVACSEPQAGATPGATPGGTAAGAAAAPAASTTAGGLTPFQLEHGIGPITSPVTAEGPIDTAMAAKGAKVFDEKCSACHKMTERYVGPALGDVTTRRSPAFVMNMALNPQEMVEKHPETRKLLAEFFVPMPNQNITPDEARAVLEHLRAQAH